MTPRMVKRTARFVTVFFVATAVLYAVMGGLLVYSAYAQETRSSIFPTPNQPVAMKVPTGSDDAAAKAFFRYNDLREVGTMQEQYFIDPYLWGTMYLVIGGVLIVLYFLTFAWYSRVRRGPDLYPVEVYNAYIAERSGPIDVLNWVVWSVLLSYMVYYTVINLMFGQYY
jgi:hypothetical protein